MTDFKNNNINKITDFIASGCKTSGEQKIGVECEHIITDKDNNPVSFYGENGIEKIISLLSEYYPEKSFSEGYLIGLNDGKVFITLEPAAQVEVSIIPLDNINDIKTLYLNFVEKITSILSEFSYKLHNIGYHPSAKADDLELIPKERYRLMDSFFLSKGNKPRYMMRGSASVQVNIDYYSEVDFSQKFRLANLLTPLFYLITDNSDIFESLNYSGFSARSYAWENVDDSRCGFLNFYTFREYADWIYSTQPIFIQKDSEDIYCGYLTNEEIFSSREISINDIKHIMSMVFPNVRVKQFIEIRAGDSMPTDFMLAYSCLIKGLFYNAEALNYFNNLFENITVEDMYDQVIKIRNDGFTCDYYGFNLKGVLKKIFEYAENNLNNEEILIMEPLKKCALSFKTLKQLSQPEVAIR